MDFRKTIAVLIAARNEQDNLDATLRSIKRQTRRPDTIIVVDDASEDRTSDIALGLGATVIRRNITERQSTGAKKSAAQNAALPFLWTDIVVTVDADTILDARALERLVAPFETESPPTGAYGYVVSQNPKSVFQRGRDIEIRVQQTFPKIAQAIWNIHIVAPGCITAWLVDAIAKRENGFLSRSHLAEDMELTLDVVLHSERYKNAGEGRIVFIRDALAFTLDPRTCSLYVRQVSRWYSAFFQVLKVHKKSLLRFKRPRLTILIGAYLLDGIGGFGLFFILPLVALSIRWSWDWNFFLLTIAGYFLVRAIYQGGVSLYEGFRLAQLARDRKIAKLILSPKDTLLSLPCYLFITDPLNRSVWIFSFIREMIFGRWFSLSVWKKGH